MLDLWDLWIQGKIPENYLIWGKELFWWVRISKMMQIVGLFLLFIEVFEYKAIKYGINHVLNQSKFFYQKKMDTTNENDSLTLLMMYVMTFTPLIIIFFNVLLALKIILITFSITLLLDLVRYLMIKILRKDILEKLYHDDIPMPFTIDGAWFIIFLPVLPLVILYSVFSRKTLTSLYFVVILFSLFIDILAS